LWCMCRLAELEIVRKRKIRKNRCQKGTKIAITEVENATNIWKWSAWSWSLIRFADFNFNC
jgi:hypothetical protein